MTASSCRRVLAGAAAVALAGASHGAASQETAPPLSAEQPPLVGEAATSTLSVEQQAIHDSWPAARRAIYAKWSADFRNYFWTLTPKQQRGWWRMTDEQRAMVYGLTNEQRTAAWQIIESRMDSASAPAGLAGESGR